MHPGRIYSLLSIYCSAAFLEKWAPHSPALSRFMQKIKNHEPAVLCDCGQVTTVQMGKAIHEMLDSSFMQTCLPYYISLKINELLIMVMDKVDRCPSTQHRQLHREDVKRFIALKEVLLESVEHPLSLKDLSRRFGLNVKKIKTGFKLLYETSPFDLLLDKRMEKAKALLRESNLSIDDIGGSVGYDNRHSFSKAFKKYAGSPPASYRKYMAEPSNPYL
jgi:AraC-like DNA-binding protein